MVDAYCRQLSAGGKRLHIPGKLFLERLAAVLDLVAYGRHSATETDGGACLVLLKETTGSWVEPVYTIFP